MNFLSHYLFQPINNSRLIAFRIVFGLVMAGECIHGITSGLVKPLYVASTYNFTFIGFEWLNALHGKGMYAYYAVMAVCGCMIAAGLLYRFSSTVLAILWTATYLSQKTFYNNHYYLMVLLCWLMVFMPANRRMAADVKLGIAKPQNECFRWQIELFIFQVACMYLFSAVAKVNSDWLNAIPLREWLHHKTGLPFIGWTFRNPLTPWVVVYGGLLFDALIIPGLLYRKTRIFAFIVSVFFHAFNGYVFKIGSFPFLAVGFSVFFFPSLFAHIIPNKVKPQVLNALSPFKVKLKSATVLLYVMFQLYLPLRHWFIEGDVMWTEEGHRMSWRMMLRSKKGECYFKVVNTQNDSSWFVNPDTVFDVSQQRALSVLPDVTWQAAQFLKNKYQEQHMSTSIYAHALISLNFRKSQFLIDTSADLAKVPWKRWGHNEWILGYSQ